MEATADMHRGKSAGSSRTRRGHTADTKHCGDQRPFEGYVARGPSGSESSRAEKRRTAEAGGPLFCIWPRGVTVSTLDSESSDRGSNPREALGLAVLVRDGQARRQHALWKRKQSQDSDNGDCHVEESPLRN